MQVRITIHDLSELTQYEDVLGVNLKSSVPLEEGLMADYFHELSKVNPKTGLKLGDKVGSKSVIYDGRVGRSPDPKMLLVGYLRRWQGYEVVEGECYYPRGALGQTMEEIIDYAAEKSMEVLHTVPKTTVKKGFVGTIWLDLQTKDEGIYRDNDFEKLRAVPLRS
jgi:hypothetical protein